MSTNFGVDSSSHFSFYFRTEIHTHTQVTDAYKLLKSAELSPKKLQSPEEKQECFSISVSVSCFCCWTCLNKDSEKQHNINLAGIVVYYKSATWALKVLMATNRILQFLHVSNILTVKWKKLKIIISWLQCATENSTENYSTYGAKHVAMVRACAAKRWEWLGEEMHRVWKVQAKR